MKGKMRFATLAIVAMMFAAPITMTAMVAVAQEAAPAVVAAAPEAAAPVAEVGLDVVFQQIMKAIGDWKSLGWQAGLAMLLTALVSTMKNTFLRGLIWSKIPDWSKILVAPILSLMIFGLGMGSAFSGAAFWAAITTGVAAVYMHELLDALKKAPFIGEKWMWLVDVIGKFFGKQPAAGK